MGRKSKSSRGSRGSFKNPQHPPPSDELPPPPPRKGKLLPPWLEKQWSAEEIWALMAVTEMSNSRGKFSDTPEYWKSIAPLFPGYTGQKLRKIHLAVIMFQKTIVLWKKDEIKTLIASVNGNTQEPKGTPQWWGEVASHLPGRNALDCRIAFNTYGLFSGVLSTPRQREIRQPVGSSSTIDAVITSFERTSVEPLKTKPEVPTSTMDAGDTSTQGTPEVKSKGKKKKKKQQEETSESSVTSRAMDEVASKKMSKGKEKMQEQEEEIWQHSFAGSTTCPGGTSSQDTPEELPITMAEGEENVQQQEEMKQESSPRSRVVPLDNWTLEDYIFLMKVLTLNLHTVDADNEIAMEAIADRMEGKTGEEVRQIVLQWRPQLLAALEKADRITASCAAKASAKSSSDSSEE